MLYNPWGAQLFSSQCTKEAKRVVAPVSSGSSIQPLMLLFLLVELLFQFLSVAVSGVFISETLVLRACPLRTWWTSWKLRPSYMDYFKNVQKSIIPILPLLHQCQNMRYLPVIKGHFKTCPLSSHHKKAHLALLSVLFPPHLSAIPTQLFMILSSDLSSFLSLLLSSFAWLRYLCEWSI